MAFVEFLRFLWMYSYVQSYFFGRDLKGVSVGQDRHSIFRHTLRYIFKKCKITLNNFVLLVIFQRPVCALTVQKIIISVIQNYSESMQPLKRQLGKHMRAVITNQWPMTIK